MSPPVERNPLSTPASPPPAPERHHRRRRDARPTGLVETCSPSATAWSRTRCAISRRCASGRCGARRPDDVKAARCAHRSRRFEPEGRRGRTKTSKRLVLPYPLGNIHPRFWGWVMGAGTPLGALSEMLAATMNSNCGGGEHVANYVEYQVIAWLKEMLHYAPDASGILVSGGSMANLIGPRRRAERQGRGRSPPRGPAGGASPHGAVRIGRDAQLGEEGAVAARARTQRAARDPGRCRFQDRPGRARSRDRRRSRRRASAVLHHRNRRHREHGRLRRPERPRGSVSHPRPVVPRRLGAFGAFAALSPRLAPKVAGMERADSLAFDLPRKWMYVPFEAGARWSATRPRTAARSRWRRSI